MERVRRIGSLSNLMNSAAAIRSGAEFDVLKVNLLTRMPER